MSPVSKSFFFFFIFYVQQQIWFFLHMNQKSFFYYSKQIWFFLIKSLFKFCSKIDLIFFTKQIFLSTQKQIWFLFMNQIIFFFFNSQKHIWIFFLKRRGYIHKINLFELMLVKCVSNMQHIIHIMQKGYIFHKSLEDQTLSGWNGCLTPSHFIT